MRYKPQPEHCIERTNRFCRGVYHGLKLSYVLIGLAWFRAVVWLVLGFTSSPQPTRALLMLTNQMRPIHPGEILREEFIEPLQLDINTLANALRIPVTQIHGIVIEKEVVDASMALRLARYFSTTPQFWLNLQTVYDLKIAERKIGNEIQQDISPLEQSVC